MDLSFEQRLLRFLDREEEDERRSARELRALSIAERVLEGECIEDALLERVDADVHVFRVAENLSKFRPGDALAVGDGIDFAVATSLVYGRYDAGGGELVLERDPFARGEVPGLEVGTRYCVDRRPLGLRGRLQDVVRAGFADQAIRDVLEGRHRPLRDQERFERAQSALAQTELNEAQRRAGAAAIGTESLALVQGPPGTGKTRLLAEVLKALCAKGCRIAVTSFTHRAVDNALLALRRIDPGLPLFKLGNRGSQAVQLRRAGVRQANPRSIRLPDGGLVVAGTSFALAKLPARERFHFAVFDEAGQLPIPHAIAGMLRAKRWLFFGDHRQLPPVITAQHNDREVTVSVFEWLHSRYGSELLDVSYRMNEAVCKVVSETFYDGLVRPDDSVARRSMPFRPGGKLDEVLDPGKGVVLARVDHLQPGMRSPEEANLCADLVDDLLCHHGIPPQDIAIIAPFRAQVRQIRSALQRRALPAHEDLVVDTVERIQGQEREVVVLSLTVGDPDSLELRSAFFFSTNRLTVALSRARTKAVLVASRGAFRALPMDPDSLRAASVFKSLYERLPQVDLTPVYASR